MAMVLLYLNYPTTIEITPAYSSYIMTSYYDKKVIKNIGTADNFYVDFLIN